MSTTKNDAQKLPQELADELSALDLPTHEERRDAVNGAPGRPGIRARFLSKLDALRHAHRHSDLLVHSIGGDINRQCDHFIIIEVLPPADSGRCVGFPRSI